MTLFEQKNQKVHGSESWCKDLLAQTQKAGIASGFLVVPIMGSMPKEPIDQAGSSTTIFMFFVSLVL